MADEENEPTALDDLREAVREMDYPELTEAARIVERERNSRAKQAKKQAQQELREVAQRYGLSVEEIISTSGSSGKRQTGRKSQGKVPPKFRHPEDPSSTWTGRGRKPRWVREWEDAGGSLDDLRIPSEDQGEAGKRGEPEDQGEPDSQDAAA